MSDQAQQTPGHDALWLWFGLDRASFLTLPRVMMHDMPDEWQQRMADLLNEWDETWVNLPEEPASTHVQFRDLQGRLTRCPWYFKNYRHPERWKLDLMKGIKP